MSRWAIITGASRGIGRDLAVTAARGGFNVAVVARSEPELNELQRELKQKYGAEVKVIVADLSNLNAAEKVFEQLKPIHKQVQVLINNAGFGDMADFKEADPQKLTEMINVNILSLTNLCRIYAPVLADNGGGRIMNVASVAGFIPGPKMAVYHASKAYVVNLGYALRQELKADNISVTTLCPGATASGFQAVANQTNSRMFRNTSKMARSIDVAGIGYDAMMTQKGLVVPGFGNKLSVGFMRLVPPSWLARLIHKLYGMT